MLCSFSVPSLILGSRVLLLLKGHKGRSPCLMSSWKTYPLCKQDCLSYLAAHVKAGSAVAQALIYRAWLLLPSAWTLSDLGQSRSQLPPSKQGRRPCVVWLPTLYPAVLLISRQYTKNAPEQIQDGFIKRRWQQLTKESNDKSDYSDSRCLGPEERVGVRSKLMLTELWRPSSGLHNIQGQPAWATRRRPLASSPAFTFIQEKKRNKDSICALITPLGKISF